MDNNVSTLWLIPARGGSKGIPDKNIRDFCGEPLVSRAVKQAIDCAFPGDTVFVSTDSPKIKEAALECGIEIPFMRPDDLASDSASTYSVIIHVLEEFRIRGKCFDRVVLLQPTSPFRLPEDIMEACNLWNPSVDMVVTVCEARTNPYYNAFETDKDGFLKISKGEGNLTRRQDAPKVWEYNGAVYVMTVSSLLREPISRFRKIIPCPMPQARSVDLDTPEDWIIAEILFEKYNNCSS